MISFVDAILRESEESGIITLTEVDVERKSVGYKSSYAKNID